ncbi:MAG: LacI family DNA-binding transcriptional regulator, partial [Demequina sp.]
MHDVAARAGVSHQTVSRVLNEFPGVRPDTRARVLAAIEEMGYRRNLSARTLATGRSHSIGVLSPEVPNFGPMSSMHAVERAAREAGFHSLVTSTTNDPERVTDALDYLLGKSVDAMVVLAQQRSVLDAVRPRVVGVPAVYLLTGGTRAEGAISVDQVEGARVAMQHLIDLGHRRIQHLTGNLDFSEAQLRRDAYVTLMQRAGLEPLPML